MTQKSTTIALLALATLVSNFGSNAFANDDGSGKFAACVQTNGGTLPALTADQKAAKKDCWQNNSDDKAKVKECVQALNLPQPDAKTQAAIKTCRADWKSKKGNSDENSSNG
jgi:hypothetical protein